VFNFKISGIAAASGFFVSLVLNLASGAAFPVFLARPIAFGVLFFVISGIIYFLISHFLPELLDGDTPVPGGRINIAEDSEAGETSFAAAATNVSAAPSVKAALADDSDENLGDISGYLQSGGAPMGARAAGPGGGSLAAEPAFPAPPVDQVDAGDYNVNGEVYASSPPGRPGGGGVSSAAPAVPGSIDILPDLDSLAGAFLPGSGDAEGDTVDYSIPSPAKKPSVNSKGQKMEGDFNPKDLAMGIRTILSKEE
jgi:hypothetical protein